MLLRACLIAFLVLGIAAHGETFVVNSAGDEPNTVPGNGTAETVPGSGIITLRSAIEEVNALEGVHRIVIGSGIRRIAPLIPLPPVTAPSTVIDGSSAVLDGRRLTAAFPMADGLVLEGEWIRLANLTIERFPGNGLLIRGGGNHQVRGCVLGGPAGEWNGAAGIRLVDGTTGNRIGGSDLLDANTIVGNGEGGVLLEGAATQGNRLQGNSIYRNSTGSRGIVIASGAQGAVAPPVLLDTRPITGETVPNAIVELFVDDGTQGERFATQVQADATGRFTADLEWASFVSRGLRDLDPEIPYRRVVTAVATDSRDNTSAFSNALPVPPEEAEMAPGVRVRRIGSRHYTPGDVIFVTLQVTRVGGAPGTVLEIVERLPTGWTLVSTSAPFASIVPQPGAGPLLRWQLDTFTGGSWSITYAAAVPENERGVQVSTTRARLRGEGLRVFTASALDEELLEDGFARFRGRVTTGGSAPIPCATVVYARTDDPGTRFVAVADSEGRLLFSMMPFGVYESQVYAPGYRYLGSGELTVGAGLISVGFDLPPAQLLPQQPPLVRGIVTDADTGLPLAGVLVAARVAGDLVAEAYTCASGRYEVYRSFWKSEPGGTIELSFSLANYLSSSQSVPEPPVGETAEANQPLAKASLFPSALLVTVRRADTGVPLPGAQVLLQGPLTTAAPTRSDGIVAFDTVPDGLYSIAATAPAFEQGSALKQVAAGEVESITLHLALAPLAADPYDINRDGAVNAVDVQLVINAALGIAIAPLNADVDSSGSVNAIDVQLVINAVLGLG